MGERDEGPPVTPDVAAGQVEQVRRRVRTKGRWHGWMWLAMAVATPVFLIGTQVDEYSWLSFWVAIAYMVLGFVLWQVDARRPVRSRAHARVERPATVAFVVTMVVVAVATIVLDPSGAPGWYVVLALLPAVPAAVAAAVVLRA